MSELEDLYQFLYLCPVGLVETDATGLVRLVNPESARLLAPLLDSPDLADLGPLLRRHAPHLLEGDREAVVCSSEEHDLWIRLELMHLDEDRRMVVVWDVTDSQRRARREADAAFEINDDIVQALVAAESCFDLDLPERGRALLHEASEASRAWIGAHYAAWGTTARGPGSGVSHR